MINSQKDANKDIIKDIPEVEDMVENLDAMIQRTAVVILS